MSTGTLFWGAPRDDCSDQNAYLEAQETAMKAYEDSLYAAFYGQVDPRTLRY